MSSKLELQVEIANDEVTVKLIGIIDEDADFSKVTDLNLKVSRNLMKLTLNKERQFFWRVCSANLKDDQFCEVSQFEMIKERAPNIYSPEQNQTIYKNQEVEFKWEHPKAQDFIVQIIKNGKIESEVVLGEPLLNYTFDELGNYKLSIKEAGQRSSVLSTQSKLITVKPLPKIETVRSITPLPAEKLFFYHQKKAKIYFEWSNVQKLDSFDIKINDQIYKAERPNMTLELEEGRYQWSVAGEFKGINKGNFNEPSQFEIINIKSSNSLPQEGTVIELERPGDEVKFEWNGDNKKFLFEVSKSKDFNQIFITKETSSTSLTQSFSQKGTFFWRAKVLNSQGKTIYSPPKKVIIKPGSAPEPLKLDEKQIFKIKRSSFNIFKKILDFIIPSANAQSQQNDYSTSEGKIKIKWPKSVKAKEYLLEIYQDQNLTNKIFSTKTKDNFHLWEYEDHDKFFFRVAIIDYWDRQTSFSNLSEVELVNEYNPREAIQLEAPKHRMSSYDNEVEFEWDDQKYAKSYKLLIAKDLKFKRITKTITTDDTDFELKLPKSRYYWKVEAYDKDGMKINTSKRRIFSLKSRPKKIKNKEKNRLVNKSATKLDKSFNKHLIAISYAPSKFSLEETSTAHNVNIDGTFLNAISLFGKYESTLDYTLRRSSGKVFNDIGFQFIETSAIYHGDWAQRFLSNTFISIGPSLKMLKSFPLNTTTLSEMNSTLFALQVGVTFGQLQTSPFEINLATSIGSFSAFEGKIRTIISEKYFLSARFESGSYEEGASEISFSSMGLEIGSTFNW
ncbi:hypothetical protein OAT67_07675 [Bacteriovoracaceae bacterium]|nr:hypothetical protein [Bacteriovoracaceae bacterium]